MKVTIDSNEPLEDALRVVGALYDVTLTTGPVAGGEQAPSRATTRTGNRRKRSGGRTTKATSRPRRTTRKAAARRGSVNTAELRAWARSNGHEVSDRGPIPASVRNAYREAQQA